MPINPKLKAQLDKMNMDDAYRTALISQLDNAPADVQNLWMAQDDYTRQVNAFNEEKKTWKTTADDFYAKSNNAIDGWKTEVQKYREASEAAQNRIKELEAGTGLPALPGENNAVAKELEGLKRLFGALEQKIGTIPTGVTEQVLEDKLNKRYQDVVGFLGETQMVMDDLGAQYHETFGKRWSLADRQAFIAHANELSTKQGRRVPLTEAYQAKYGNDLQKLHDDQVAAAAIEKYKTANSIPNAAAGGPGPGAPDKGPLQIRLDQERNRQSGAKDGVGYSSWQEAAAAAGNELVSEGKY